MPFIIIDELNQTYGGGQKLHADKNFNANSFPFLNNITYADGSLGGHFIIRSPGIVFLMNEFEKCGYRQVAQTSDKSGFIRVTMHIKNNYGLTNNCPQQTVTAAAVAVAVANNNKETKEESVEDEIIINNTFNDDLTM